MKRLSRLSTSAQEPGLLDIPRILVGGIGRLLGRAFFLVAGVTFLVTVALLWLSLFFATIPAFRHQLRNRKTQAVFDLVLAGIEFVNTFGGDHGSRSKTDDLPN